MAVAVPDFRLTRQRKVILEELRRAKSHPTADQVYERVRRRLPRISLGTVYRNLEVLAERGVISRLDLPRGPRRFCGDSGDHYHARCLVCGRIVDAPVHRCEDLERLYRNWRAFRVLAHRLEFVGLCKDCLGKRRTGALDGLREVGLPLAAAGDVKGRVGAGGKKSTSAAARKRKIR